MQSHWQGVGCVVNIQVFPLDSNVRVGEIKSQWLSKLTHSSVRLVEAPPGSPVGPCSPGVWLFQTLTSLSDLTAILATVSRRWFTKRRAASLEGSPVYRAPPGPRRFPGCISAHPPAAAGTEAPSPTEHGHRRWYTPCPSASQPRDVRVCGTGAGVQGVLKSTASQVMLMCSRDETHGSAVCSSQTSKRKPREVKSLA